MAEGLAAGWKELPTWAKWTVGIGGGGAVAFIFLRGRGGATATVQTPAAKPPVLATPSTPASPAPYSGPPSGWDKILQQLQTSQASLVASQSQLAADIHMIAAHQQSPAAATGNTSVHLSGGMVASDNMGKGPGTAAAQWAARFDNPTQVTRDEQQAANTSNQLGASEWATDRGAPAVNGTTTTGYVIGATADPTKGTIDFGTGGSVTVNSSIQEEQAKSKRIESGQETVDVAANMRAYGYVQDAGGNWVPGRTVGTGPP